jgi:AbrB family looped-hinge helix DNA binding protein
MATRTVKVTRKGQITLPVELRKEFGIEEGDVLYVVKGERGIEIRTPGSFIVRTAGIFREYAANTPPFEPGEIRELAARAWVDDLENELDMAEGGNK